MDKLMSIIELTDNEETDNEIHQIDNCNITSSSSSSKDVSSHDEKVKLCYCNNPDNCYCKRKLKNKCLNKTGRHNNGFDRKTSRSIV